MTVTAVPLQPVKRSYIVWIWVGIAIAVAAAFLLARQGDDFFSNSLRASGVQTTASGLKYKIITPGSGPHPTDTDVALVNYEGKLRNGQTFDKSQQPTPMPIRGVVPGFSEGLKLMNKGAKYRFWLPAKLAYGEKGAGPIPPSAPLVFDVELIEFLPQSVIEQYQRQQQMMGGAPGGMGGPGGGDPSLGGGPGGPGGAPGGAPGEEIAPPPGQ
jgi:FKBP-type peptidyl-prolyl cis-trans isomerase FkpA